MEKVLTNQTMVGARRETVKGKDYAIYPVVLMVEGVHHAVNGSPVYYPLSTLEGSVLHWEGRPVPVMHPNVGGEYVRANSPHVEADWVIGRIYNATVQDGKLKGEAWIDVSTAEQIAPGLVMSLDSGTQMEVSTGIMIQGDNTPGVWNDEPFGQTIINMVPDHLALLPGDVGACSWEDGCGVRANKGGLHKKVDKALKKSFYNSDALYKIKGNQGEPTMEKLDFAIFQLNKQPDEGAKLGLLSEMAHEFLGLRQKSFGELEESVRVAVRSLNGTDGYPHHWAREVYPDSVIYEKEDEAGEKLFKQSYMRNEDGTVALLDDAVEVKEEREFVPVNNVNNGDNNMSEKTPCCPEKVNALIANEATAFTDADRDFLSALSEEQVTKLHDTVTTNAQDDGVLATKDEEITTLKAKLATLETNTAGTETPKTAEEYINQAPPEIAAVLNAGKQELEAKRTRLIGSITANQRNTFTPEQLQAMGVPQLEAIAALATTTDYSVNSAGNVAPSGEEPYVADTPLFPTQ